VKRLPSNPLISRALEVLEKKLGREELCIRINAPEALIRAWQFGHASMPEHKFLRLVDILTELDATWTEWDEAKPEPKDE
jgi:hypothetical protein